MDLGHRERARTREADSGYVWSLRRMRGSEFASAPAAPMYWKTGWPPGLSRLRAPSRVVGREHDHRAGRRWAA
jgi:hypothetical protein